jgi:hypothetical protein
MTSRDVSAQPLLRPFCQGDLTPEGSGPQPVGIRTVPEEYGSVIPTDCRRTRPNTDHAHRLLHPTPVTRQPRA